MANNNNKLKAYVRYDGTGRVLPGGPILQRFKPKVGNWVEIDSKECCNFTPTPEPFGLRFTTIIDDPELQQGYVRFLVIEDGGSVNGVINWGDGTIESINIPDDGSTHTFTHDYLEGNYTGVITLDSPEKLLELYFDGNDD